MGDETNLTGCVVCGDQPRGEIFGKPVCHVNHAEEVVNGELRALIEREREIYEPHESDYGSKSMAKMHVNTVLDQLEDVIDS